MSHCVNCGQTIADGRWMCGLCGPYPPRDEEMEAETNLVRPNRLIILIVIGLVVALFLTILLVAS